VTESSEAHGTLPTIGNIHFSAFVSSSTRAMKKWILRARARVTSVPDSSFPYSATDTMSEKIYKKNKILFFNHEKNYEKKRKILFKNNKKKFKLRKGKQKKL
jgi:hypothetical protein